MIVPQAPHLTVLAVADIWPRVYLPGTRIKTSPTDVAPLEQLQMMRFKGETWELFGPVTSGEKNS